MPIEKSAGYTHNGTDYHATLESAQTAALADVFGAMEPLSESAEDIAKFAMSNAPAILEILATKHRGRPRKMRDATKLKKAKLRTAPLPLAEKEGA